MKNLELLNKSVLKSAEIYEHEIYEAIENSLAIIKKRAERFGDKFTGPCTENFIYPLNDNHGWVEGMLTGQYWLSFQLSGDEEFKNIAEKNLKSFRERLGTKRMDTHDVGFLYTPSCVAAYKVTGNEEAKEMAIKAAEELMHYRWCERDGFIKRGGHRLIIDTMLNIPLLFWASEVTGDEKYKNAAISHYKLTAKYIVRDDFSTNHHFQINEETGEPIGGVTLQGNGDNSCWSRGHSWGVYGYPIAYSYCGDEEILPLHQNLTYYFLNGLSFENLPYWDFDFKDGDGAPYDSSAAAISVCGLDEMCRILPDNAPQKEIFKNARDNMMRALLDKCAVKPDDGKEGILCHVTHALPQGQGIDQCGVYGDYFFLEALARYKNNNFIRYW